MCVSRYEPEHYLYHLRPATTVWARVAAVNAKGKGVFSASAIFLTSQNEPMELVQMCVPDRYAHQATMQHRTTHDALLHLALKRCARGLECTQH